MTGATDQDHLVFLELVVRSLADCLPPGPVVQYDGLTQLVHREYVLMGIEKVLHSLVLVQTDLRVQITSGPPFLFTTEFCI